MDVFPANGLQHDGIDVLPCGSGRFHLVEQVETVMLERMIKEERASVFSLQMLFTRGTHHILARGHRHPLRIASANTVILVVTAL